MIVNIYPSKTYARVPLLSPTHYCWHSLYLTASIWSTNIFLYMHISRTFLPLFHLNATKSTTFMGVIDLFQIICALCMVQNQQLQIGLFRIIVRASSLTVISMLFGREPVFEGGGKCSNCFARRWLCMWTPRVAFSSKPHWQTLQEQRSQRRCWSCLWWGVPRFLHKNNIIVQVKMCK